MAVQWVTPEQVKAVIGLPAHAAHDDARLRIICDGLNDAVTAWRPDITPPDTRITLGLVALAQRMYSGLGTGGAEQYDDQFGIPPVISREVEVLLEIGRGFRPCVS
jgi:hypothetical protein